MGGGAKIVDGGGGLTTLPTVIDADGTIKLRLLPAVEISDDAFLELCAQNDDLRLERTADGEIVILPPTGGSTGNRNITVAVALGAWARADGTGLAFDSSTGYRLPNDAIRSPDASWVARDRLDALAPSDLEGFLPLCPDFAVELRSPSDRLGRIQGKIDEFLAQGTRLAWLIDPFERTVHIYRPGCEVKILREPADVAAEPELPGFSLALKDVWAPLD